MGGGIGGGEIRSEIMDVFGRQTIRISSNEMDEGCEREKSQEFLTTIPS